MDFIKFSINKPVSVIVGVILIVLFGIVGMRQLPIQLTPDVEMPQITVRTTWPGASPYEIEKDIIEAQEEVLKGIQGLTLMESSSFNNMGEITLTFSVGIDMDAALLRVSNKLNEVRSYPENVEKPVIDASGAQSSPVIWMMLKNKVGPSEKINTFRTFFENEVRQYLERVPGVGSLFVFGGTDKQLEIVISPVKLSRYNMTIGTVINRIKSSNSNVSAGILALEKNNYRIRTVSEYQNKDDPMNILLKDDGIRRIYLKDVASSRYGYATNDVSVMHNGVQVIVIGVRKEQGANVIQLTKNLKKVVEKLNDDLLKDHDLFLDWVYDQTPYINKAINLVQQNVIIGGLLAFAVLIIFLRSFASTLATAIAIPISVIGTFIFMWIFQRSLNVVSLAGISFAVGMLVDNAIVVLENIDRHRKMGKNAFKASYEGAQEVWGAVLASTITTVAVFLPVIFIAEEAGQLFRDIAIAITFAIIISLIVSISVIPTITNKLYRFSSKEIPGLQFLAYIGNFFSNFIIASSRLTLKNVYTRSLTIVILTGIAIYSTMLLMPKAEYLPQGNRNLILNIIIPPPGYSIIKRQDIGHHIFKTTRPYFETDNKDGIPQIKDIFYVAAGSITLFGGISEHETEARKMIPLFNRIINSIPGIFGVSLQAGIFQNRIGRGRTVDVNISGENIDNIVSVSRILFGTILQSINAAQVRPVPSLENSYPEANFIPDRSKTLANGITEQELGFYIDVIMDGRKVGEFKPETGKKMDLVLRSDQSEIIIPENIKNSVIANSFGNLIRIGDIAQLKYDQGMMQINHLERKRTIKLEVTPPQNIALQEAMEIIENEIEKLNKSDMLKGTSVSVGGNADKLSQARQAIQWNLLMAVVIIYLLMSALFENFFYPFIILFTVPLASAGGFMGLRLVDLYIAPQPFDIVTMLGFIILVGTVVNNAILIVYQSLNNVRYGGIFGIDAVIESVKTRIRPIFMSTTTSLFGMLPLVISTGAGSELYRGLGSVLLGGLAVSTIFTLFVIPSLLSFFIGFEKKRINDNEIKDEKENNDD
ncbi:MAG: hydrophobic/amphiphilic exporter-1, HAE1 family [Candidatus Magnetoglobus multicellularis str. Araruama]|uniref:Hydrophobic/amphiphilic exporter-1, HAE1 family n=1 Tax=Candidatus Magnetoglobus multicellularis str. Araruama TaxID=890399 RepID=A0A1V1P9G8_9BACT|nr:MAG: hydrophobic/amphiphilic exporter-1, HAE1 family [Candidatus Magnetoglobus multicellularis str. Araruama]